MNGSKKKSKGQRLNWTLLKDVKPIVLDESMTKGERILDSFWKNNKNKGICLMP